MAAKGNHLHEMLSDLKDRGLIDPATYNTATGVRQFGGYGAHPQDDYLKDVDRGVADLVLKVTQRLIQEFAASLGFVQF